jgi:hypothetical protein
MKLPVWLPAIAYKAQLLYLNTAAEKDPIKAREVILRLIGDKRMERVWARLYQQGHSESSVKQYQYAGRVTPASIAKELRRLASQLRKSGTPSDKREAEYLEFEATVTAALRDHATDPKWSEQDRAVQLFFYHIYKCALYVKPMMRRDLEAKCKSLRRIAERLGKLAATLDSLGLQTDALNLKNVANNCESEAQKVDPHTFADDPALLKHVRGDEDRRTFIIETSGSAKLIFGHSLYSAIATIANVLFDYKVPIVTERVREMLRVKQRSCRRSQNPCQCWA